MLMIVTSKIGPRTERVKVIQKKEPDVAPEFKLKIPRAPTCPIRLCSFIN